MQYDLERAAVLLSDLETIGRGQMPAVELPAPADGSPALTGTCSRLGLLRMAIRLARAALSAKSSVVVYDNGWVEADGSSVGGVVQMFLTDDPSPPPRRESHPPQWASVVGAFGCIVAALCVIGLVSIGLVSVARWLVALLG